MILAAGRGERMRPLTDTLPKPLQQVQGRPLIQWQIEALVAAGFTELVINHAWLGEQIEAFVGNGSQWGASVQWSREGQALGTAGGIVTALPHLTAPRFLVVSADIFTGYSYDLLKSLVEDGFAPHIAAHLVLVAGELGHPDFSLREGRVVPLADPGFTYGNIGVFQREFFAGLPAHRKIELGPLLHRAVEQQQLSGELFTGPWFNVGSVADLNRLNRPEFSPKADA
jgi:MurNAc alpha-1-phosphate uridylyltransferase